MEATLARLKTIDQVTKTPSHSGDPTKFGKEVILKGEKFTDQKFPPKMSSIFSKRQQKFDPDKVERWK